MTKTTKIVYSAILFTVLMTWPLIPFIAGQLFTSSVLTAASQGAAALGLQ